MTVNIIKSNFLLTIVCLISISSGGCGGVNFQPRPEDEVIRLNAHGESPKAKDGNYKSGDRVALIKNDNSFSIGEEISECCEELVLVSNNFTGTKKWLPSKQSNSNGSNTNGQVIEKTATKGYKLVFGGRSKYYEWFPAEQIFPVPWANNVNLKIGDVVYKKGFGSIPAEKVVISRLPVNKYTDFEVQSGGSKTATSAGIEDLYAHLAPAKPEDLSPGAIVYYDKARWAIVIAKRNDKIIIREEHSMLSDLIVDISKLQILK